MAASLQVIYIRSSYMKEKLYTPERWENVNSINKGLMKVYLRSLVTNRRRPRTIEQYTFDLKFFLVWNYLYNENMSVLDFKKRHFEEFKFFMIEERDASNARINRIMSAIRTMMSYAEDDDDEYEDYVRNVAAKIKGLEKNPKRDVAFITEAQIVLLRDYLKEHKILKHMFLLDLLYDSGARISEIYQVNNVYTADKGYVKVTCKGGRNEYILLHERAKESLELYLCTLEDKNNLWVTNTGSIAVNGGTLRGWVKEMYIMLKQLDSSTPYFTPHSFRHSMIENLGNGTHYLCEKIGRAFTTEEIAILVHHKSTDMTKSYMKPKDDKIIMELFGIKLD